MFRRHIFTLFTVVGITASALAIMRVDNPHGSRLEDNEEYQQLMAESERLTVKEDSIRSLLSDTRAMMRSLRDTANTPIDMDAYATRIVQLEEELFNVTSDQGLVANRINAIEMAAIEQQFAISIFEKIDNTTEAPMHQEFVYDEDGDAIPLESVEVRNRRNILDNDCFVNSLAAADLDELRALQQNEGEVERLSGEYRTQYELITTLDEKYAAATTQYEADSLYNHFEPMTRALDSLNTLMSQRWNHIIDTKYYAYGYVAEKRRNTVLLDRLDDDFTAMLQQCASNDNIYASNALMRYAIGRPAVLDFEISMADELGLSEAKDSLEVVRNNIVTPNYQYTPFNIPERRLFIDFSDITFGRTNYYNNSNPAPELVVYERGVIYRVLLGVFKSRQPMTLFKGVQPLYIDNSEGRYHYYTGGFATLEEAETAQRMLLNKGFKAPEICCWIDGVMTNLSEDSGMSATDKEESPATVRYMLRIAEGDMSEALEQYIGENHPDKMISLTNEGYIVGAFDNHDEATRLYISLGEEYDIEIEILEIELH